MFVSRPKLNRSITRLVAVFAVAYAAVPTLGQDDAPADEPPTVQIEPMVITATRIPTDINQVGSSVSIIDAADIKVHQHQMVGESINTLPGVNVYRHGGYGGLVTIHMRGTDQKHTMVRLDGVDIADPSNVGGTPFIDHLTTDQIERIEVLRGPQSVLYGSHAIGGVVNIVTKKGAGDPKFSILAEGGSFATSRERFTAAGSFDMFNYNVGVSRVDSDSITAAAGGVENDPYRNTSFNARVGVDVSDQFSVNVYSRFIEASVEFDNGFPPFDDQEGTQSESDQWYVKIEPELILFDGMWEQKLGLSRSSSTRDYIFDTAFGTFFSAFEGETSALDWQNTVNIDDVHTVLFGVNTKDERSTLTASTVFTDVATYAGYAQHSMYLWERLAVVYGFRHTDHEIFGDETNYQVSLAYELEQTGTTLRGSYGTGFRAPSLSELFDFGGSTDLLPEKSKGWDIGIEQTLFDDTLNTGVTYFSNEVEQMIVSTGFPLFTLVNLNEGKTQGIESFIDYAITDQINLRWNYTYTDSEDQSGARLNRRPLHKTGIDLIFQLLENATATVSLQHASEINDVNGTAGDYVLVNVTGSYEVNEHVRVFGRVMNLFDEDYETVFSYETPGIHGIAGMEFTF